MKLKKTTYLISLFIAGCLLYSCANIGRPEGGDKDITPPVFVKSIPNPNTLNYSKNKVEIYFDEIVQLKDQTTKVVVSPVQKENPVIRASGKKITIEFRDSLKPNTTYSIDFSDAIEDNNEGNPLDGFSFAFSTGNSIDSLQVSGMVLGASNLEPAQSMIVGIHSNLEDSAFYKLPLDRIARTNELGQFTIRNLKPGKYRIYALNDADRNYKFARSEDMAFYNDIVIPSARPIDTTDTIFTAKHKVDSTFAATHTQFLPNDILLSLFNEGYKSLYLLKSERTDARRLSVIFSAPTDSLPTLEILKPQNHRANWALLDRSAHNDSLTYWLTDPALIAADSITVKMRYLRTDTTSHITFTTDTIHFNLKKFKKHQAEKEAEKAKKLKEKELKEGKDTVPPVKTVQLMLGNSGTVDVYDALHFSTDEPLDSISQDAVHLEMKTDTVWNKVADPPRLLRDSLASILSYRIDYKWAPGGSYRLTIDSLAVKSLYGLSNKTVKEEFTVRNLEDYANLFFRVNTQGSAFVELLDGSDKVRRTAKVVSGQAEFFNITPGDYYARIILDANANGKWDTGNFAQHLQPEEVYYYPKKLSLKKNWDVDQSWDIYELPIDKQKPDAIKKNKPKKKKNALDDETKKKQGEEEDQENQDQQNFNTNFYSGNKYTDFQNNNR